MNSQLIKMVLVGVVMFLWSVPSHANGLSVTQVAIGTRDPSAKTVVVKFDVSWLNSWRTKINHDAVWLTVRLNNSQLPLTSKQLCQISAAGLNPVGSSMGDAANLALYVPSDRRGAFLRRSTNGPVGNVSAQGMSVTINYQSCGFADSDQIYASVFGLEMVYIPQGSFYAGDYNASLASFNKGTSDSNPWAIASENAIPVTNPSSNAYRYVSNNNPGEFVTGSLFTIPAEFPKGYHGFYVMKYELNEGQWVEFLNSLPSVAARVNHDLTDNIHKNADSVVNRNTISCAGSPLVCSTLRPARALSFVSWMDLVAFLDWNALRPISELEFEKMSRGPVLPLAGEYPWGSMDITGADIINATEDGTEIITTTGANAHFNTVTLSGGDSSLGVDYQTGPLRNGIFALSTSTRVSAGASYYGVMDLAGNLKERVVTIGNSAGLLFTGAHGDGVLTTVSGYEGNANATGWPGIDAAVDRGVTGALGSGFRGGSWGDGPDRLRVSDRLEAALTSTIASNTFGGRGARTYDGN